MKYLRNGAVRSHYYYYFQVFLSEVEYTSAFEAYVAVTLRAFRAK